MQFLDKPKNAQLLYFPVKRCTIAAGYKNTAYAKYYGYTHYGVDFNSDSNANYDCLSLGNGTVIGVEKNSNSIGGVVVVQYNDVYNPSTKVILPLIARYYHLYSISVKKGEKVTALQKLGVVHPTHKWWNHVHVELDTDIKYPFYTPQVSEDASKLLVRKGATDKTLLNPMQVLVIADGNSCMLHPKAVYANVADVPNFTVRAEQSKETVITNPTKIQDGKIVLNGPVEKPNATPIVQTAQKLILPIDHAKLTCGYKNEDYRQTYGFAHYGVDLVSVSGNREIHASGSGTVIKAGLDGLNGKTTGNGSGSGYVLIIVYDKAISPTSKLERGYTFTYMHLGQPPLVKDGDRVKAGMLLGYYGATGMYINGAHLHLQIDTDTKNPLYCMGMASTGHAILKRGTVDSTMNPCDVLFLNDGQTIIGGKYTNQYNAADVTKLASHRV